MTWILIDVSYLAHRARHALKNMEYEDIPTGVLYGFFEQLFAACSHPKLQSNRVALFFDSRQSYRSRAYEPYKKKRRQDRTEEEVEQIKIMYKQVNALYKTILPSIGFPVYKQTGLECDDLMAEAASSIEYNKKEKAILVTADGDMYQCIRSNVHFYDPGRDLYLTPETFLEKKQIESHRWALVKALAGCNSDNVEGLPGVGEKTAVKFLKLELPKHHKTYKLIESKEGREIAERNLELVELPHTRTRPVGLTEPVYNKRAFMRFARRYGILSYLKNPKRRRWSNFFEGEFNRQENKVRKRRR